MEKEWVVPHLRGATRLGEEKPIVVHLCETMIEWFHDNRKVFVMIEHDTNIVADEEFNAKTNRNELEALAENTLLSITHEKMMLDANVAPIVDDNVKLLLTGIDLRILRRLMGNLGQLLPLAACQGGLATNMVATVAIAFWLEAFVREDLGGMMYPVHTMRMKLWNLRDSSIGDAFFREHFVKRDWGFVFHPHCLLPIDVASAWFDGHCRVGQNIVIFEDVPPTVGAASLTAAALAEHHDVATGTDLWMCMNRLFCLPDWPEILRIILCECGCTAVHLYCIDKTLAKDLQVLTSADAKFVLWTETYGCAGPYFDTKACSVGIAELQELFATETSPNSLPHPLCPNGSPSFAVSGPKL